MKSVTELYCHGCRGYVRFVLDTEVNGDHVVACPKCGHEHRRTVTDGRVEEHPERTHYAPAHTYMCYLDATWSLDPTTAYNGDSAPDLWDSWLGGYYTAG